MNTVLKWICPALIFIFQFNYGNSQDKSRWQLTDNGGIKWEVEANDSHMDHIEMSGLYVSAIVYYGVENGAIKQSTHIVFPMLRTIPNNTHASLSDNIYSEGFGQIKINGKTVNENPFEFTLKGILSYQSKTEYNILIKHQLYPSVDKPVFIDKIEISNPTAKSVSVELPKVELIHTTDAAKGVDGAYSIKVVSSKHGNFVLNANESLDYALIYSGRKDGAEEPYISADYELNKRKKLVDETFADLVFESPDPVLNRAFSFAKIRAVESIYETKGGLMHGPGGGAYYAAIWANDQAEYANPFFPFLGNLEGNESALNSFRHFARFTTPDYKQIPSSIIAEGIDIWNGAGDRGDMAMIAYGAARFALAYGDKNKARELWPLIEWCLEYCKRKVNDDGVVTSDSDELEGRFPAGDANLNTSSLYYDALISAAYLGKELEIEQSILDGYTVQAENIKSSIEAYFGSTISGYETYRYYDGNDILRAWICTPLTVGIFDRSEGTIKALFSDQLWTEDGLASAAGSTTFWDRATLYALRGVFAAGDTKDAMPFFSQYSKRRLLGEHVPYPVEAYPEGNQRHLSAESALYCRIVTEGIFGIRPVGLHSFQLSPKLPEKWDSMALRNVKAFGESFDIEIKKVNNNLSVKVLDGTNVIMDTQIEQGKTLRVDL